MRVDNGYLIGIRSRWAAHRGQDDEAITDGAVRAGSVRIDGKRCHDGARRFAVQFSRLVRHWVDEGEHDGGGIAVSVARSCHGGNEHAIGLIATESIDPCTETRVDVELADDLAAW